LKESLKRWEEFYRKNRCLKDTYSQANIDYIRSFCKDLRNIFILDVGSGFGFTSLRLAKEGAKVVGLDFAKECIRTANNFFQKEGAKGDFVVADAQHLPFKDGVFDVAHSASCIDFCKIPYKCVEESTRVLSENGMLIANVPLLSLSTFAYFQFRGLIPDMPVLRSIANFIQIRLLKGKYAKHEKFFTEITLRKMFVTARLTNLKTMPYTVKYPIACFKNRFLKRCFRKLIRLKPFWPWLVITGEKSMRAQT